MKTIFENLKIILVALFLSFAFNYVYAEWFYPTSTAPGGNLGTPINVDSTQQIKLGSGSMGDGYDGNLGSDKWVSSGFILKGKTITKWSDICDHALKDKITCK